MLRPTGAFEALARQWRSHVQILLVLCFVISASALSDDSSAISSVGTPVNAGFTNGTALGQDSHYLYKRAGINSRSNVAYTSTCLDDQVTYLDSSLSEAKDLASRAVTAISELLDIMRLKEQPKHWPSASYTRRYRNFLLWGSLFGEPILQRGVGKRTLQDTITTMATVKSMLNSWPDSDQEFLADEYIKPLAVFMRVRNALDVKKNNFQMIINCHDDWLVYSHDEEIPDGKDGKVLSPDRQSSTFASMKGKRFKDVKEYAAAGTILHEVTHSEKTLGDYATADVQITYQGKIYSAYGGVLCRHLAMTFTGDTEHPELNADTLALFGLGVYYSQCNWANPDKPENMCDF
ncbi:hypothetical protein N7445_006265 [Penicillium cf. griseofulvum]|nr:hypothetical protein N7445_006265 [Penicillium cf. griseofulvum]